MKFESHINATSNMAIHIDHAIDKYTNPSVRGIARHRKTAHRTAPHLV